MTTTRERPARPTPAGGSRRGPVEASASSADRAHPRMRARRVEIARHAGRRRLRRVVWLLAVVCAAVWSGVLLRSPFLDIDHIQVTGTRHQSQAEVVAASTLDPGEPMAELDLGAAATRVEALPWVETARVVRLWPGTVRITVRERTPVAVVATPGGWALLDRRGRVLDRSTLRPDDLVVVRGTRSVVAGDGLGPADRRLLRVVDRLPAELAGEVSTAWVGPDGLQLALRDGFGVVMGDGSDLLEKVTAAAAVRATADPDLDGCRIDVRVPSAPVLTEAGDCA